MLSRIFWIGIAGIAIVAGMIMQNGRSILSWGDSPHHARSQRIESRVDAAIDRSVDRMQVVGSDGEAIDVSPEAKRVLRDQTIRRRQVVLLLNHPLRRRPQTRRWSQS